MVGWRNYFDLKQSEPGAHYVMLMENLEGRESEPFSSAGEGLSEADTSTLT